MPAVARLHTDIILRLKAEKEKRGYTNADIKHMVDAQSEAPAPSERTIQKVFAPNSENEPFVYDFSLKALVIVLINPTGELEPYDEDKAENYYSEIENLKALIIDKNVQIEALQRDNDMLKKENAQLRAAKDYVKEQCANLMRLLENITGRKE